MFNKDFYPTPKRLAGKMTAKINGTPRNILEPSAGKGDLVEEIKNWDHYGRPNISVIEKDPELMATLLGKNIKVVDSDFLNYSGPDKYDLIIANPPFEEGDKHLLKAIDILYRGQIIFLLNAETIKNPCTNTRKLLNRKLEELGASIEFHQGMFQGAGVERKTGVEVALIDINIERKIEDDLFVGADDVAEESQEEIEDPQEISTGVLNIKELVAEYNQLVSIGTETIVNYYKNYRKIGGYIGLNDKVNSYESGDLTTIMQNQLNGFLEVIRKDFWRKTLKLREVKNRMTEKKRVEFEERIGCACDMNFTENNIRAFILNLINGYEKTLTDAVLEIFDKFTIQHCYREGYYYEKNIHYFNGWKTNKSFKVGKKVIIPVRSGYGAPFRGDYGGWKLNYVSKEFLDDIDIVMSYFDGMRDYKSISQALHDAFQKDESTNIASTFFNITVYKKGTIHLTFRDENILRRFNVTACKGKKWLPEDYGIKSYDLLDSPEKETVNSFEGERVYSKNVGKSLFAFDDTALLKLHS